MGIEPEDLPRQLQRIAELTPATVGTHRLPPAVETLLARSVEPHNLQPDGRYTVPRSFGVYELQTTLSGAHRYHLGNHPVRQRELTRDVGSCRLIAVFLDRQDAQELQRLLNAGD